MSENKVNEVKDDDDECTPPLHGASAELASGGKVPVGITIAYKRHSQESSTKKKSIKKSKIISVVKKSSSSNNKKRSISSIKKKDDAKKYKKPVSSFSLFMEGSIVYILCLVLPTMLGYVLNFYDVWKYEHSDDSLLHAVVTTLTESLHKGVEYVCRADSELIYSQSRSSSSGNETSVAREGIALVSKYSMEGTSWFFHKTSLCDRVAHLAAEENNLATIVSNDTDFWKRDVWMVAISSLLLAVLRILIVRRTVPLEDSSNVEALVRCKSIHLLSSDYGGTMTPVGTPVAERKVQTFGSDRDGNRKKAENDMTPFMLPDLHGPNDHHHDDHDLGMQLDDSEHDMPVDGDEPLMMSTPQLPFKGDVQSPPRTISSTGAVAPRELDKLFDDNDDADDGGFLRTPLIPPNQPSSETETKRNIRKRLNAAPRYATALFRLFWSTVAAVLALYYFRDANFWPWYVFGHGSTANCWDLSGGLTVGMDSDFDQRNAVLKQYFLGQASYHWHSGAFHILSMFLLILHPAKRTKTTQINEMQPHPPARVFGSVRSTTTAYIRSLAQHLMALVLIASAYVFSSLRRLGAIGIFAFDFSSWFLHLMQVCINAPQDSAMRRSSVISCLYWCAVIPSFVTTRFFIWPALWYSAAVESRVWLAQLEKTLWPGSATLLRCVFHFWMVLIQILNVVYFRRLLNHPHLQGILLTETKKKTVKAIAK